MHDAISSEIHLLINNPIIDKETLTLFLLRLSKESAITKPNNPFDHFCACFIPFHQASKHIFLVHHKKANSWIMAGGHIDIDESPIQTVIRESKEELGYTPKSEKLDLFNISITECNPGYTCKIHYDIWYLLSMDNREQFTADMKEFYDAGWFSFKDAIKKVTYPPYNAIINKLLEKYGK